MDKYTHCTLHAIKISKCVVVPAEVVSLAQFCFPEFSCNFCITAITREHYRRCRPGPPGCRRSNMTCRPCGRAVSAMGMLVIVQNEIIVPAQEIELEISWSGPVGSAA